MRNNPYIRSWFWSPCYKLLNCSFLERTYISGTALSKSADYTLIYKFPGKKKHTQIFSVLCKISCCTLRLASEPPFLFSAVIVMFSFEAIWIFNLWLFLITFVLNLFQSHQWVFEWSLYSCMWVSQNIFLLYEFLQQHYDRTSK